MFQIIRAKIYAWKVRRREEKIKFLRERLDWANEVLRSIKEEGEAMSELIDSGRACSSTHHFLHENRNLRVRYSQEKAFTERRLAELGVAV